jgi:hypothetical protein
MIIQLELRADAGILELGKLRIMHHDESILRIDILNFPLDEVRSPSGAPMFMTVEVARFMAPLNMEVTNIMR